MKFEDINKKVNEENIKLFKRYGISKDEDDIYTCVCCGKKTSIRFSNSIKGAYLVCDRCVFDKFTASFYNCRKWQEEMIKKELEEETLTEKEDTTLTTKRYDYLKFINEEEANRKLLQLINIEKELGIDLITLFKTLNQGIKEGDKSNWDLLMKYFEIAGKGNEISLWLKIKLNPKDYGKTWAFTKEELEDDK